MSTGRVPGDRDAPARFSPQTLYRAASLYYDHGATQAEVAARFSVSRATVSRLLAEARRRGIVTITVVEPDAAPGTVEAELAETLGLDAVHVEPDDMRDPRAPLATALARALEDARLRAGEVLLVSSGHTVYRAAQGRLPRLPGVVVVPMLGGQDEPEPWFQTNEVARVMAERVGGRPVFLYAPALPGPELHASLVAEPSIHRVLELWRGAACAVLGIGAPLLTRSSIPTHLPSDDPALNRAGGDICSRFFSRTGEPVSYPGDERLVAVPLALLHDIPRTIGVAFGEEKVGAVLTAARAGYVRRLVTDAPTAAALRREAHRS